MNEEEKEEDDIFKEEKENPEMIKKKVQAFFEQKISVHIVLTNRKFYNGSIEKISADYFIIRDKRLELMPVFFLEVFKIEPLEIKPPKESDFLYRG